MRCYLQVDIPCQCSHGGRVEFPDGQAGVILGGQPVVTEKMLLAATIRGCPLTRPCDKVVAIVSGPVTGYATGDSRPLSADFVALTNGGPPGVVSATGQEASCVTFAAGHGAPPQHPPSRSNEPSLKGRLLVVTVVRQLPAGAAHLIPDLPPGVTVTAVQPGKPSRWRSQFVWFEANGEGAAVFDLPADADTFVLVTSHPLVQAVHQLEPVAAPLPFAGGPGEGVTVERGGRFAARFADVIAAAPDASGLTPEMIARLNVPWAKELPAEPLAGLVWRPPQRFAAGSPIRVKVAPSFPKLLDLAHATTAAEAVACDLVPAGWPSIRERLWLAALCEAVADSPPFGANVLATLPPDGERVSKFLLRQHTERTAAKAERVRPRVGELRRTFGDDGRAVADDFRRFVTASPFFLGTVKLRPNSPPAVVAVHDFRTDLNPACVLVDRALAAADGLVCGMLDLQSVLSDGRPIPDAEAERWRSWYGAVAAEWLVGDTQPEVGGSASAKPAAEPLTGWRLLLRRAKELADSGFDKVKGEPGLRSRVVGLRKKVEVLTAWTTKAAVLSPVTRALERLYPLLDRGEVAAARLTKGLTQVAELRRLEAKFDGQLKEAARLEAKALKHQPAAAAKVRRGAEPLRDRGRAVDATIHADAQARVLRYLLVPVVVLRMADHLLDSKPGDDTPLGRQVLDHIQLGGELTRLVWETRASSATAAADVHATQFTAVGQEPNAVATREIAKLRDEADELTRNARQLGRALKAVNVYGTLRDVAPSLRGGDTRAGAWQLLGVLLPWAAEAAIGLVPGVGLVAGLLFGATVSAVVRRFIDGQLAALKVTADDWVLAALLKDSEFGIGGATRDPAPPLALTGGDPSQAIARRNADFAERVYTAAPHARVHSADVRRHLYLAQWQVWAAAVPVGPRLEPGRLAGLAVCLTPRAEFGRFFEAALHNPTLPADVVPPWVTIRAFLDHESGQQFLTVRIEPDRPADENERSAAQFKLLTESAFDPDVPVKGDQNGDPVAFLDARRWPAGVTLFRLPYRPGGRLTLLFGPYPHTTSPESAGGWPLLGPNPPVSAHLVVGGVPLSGALPPNPRAPDLFQVLLVHGRRTLQPGEVYDGLVGKSSPWVVERQWTSAPVRSATVADLQDAVSRAATSVPDPLELPLDRPALLRPATVEVWPRPLPDVR